MRGSEDDSGDSDGGGGGSAQCGDAAIALSGPPGCGKTAAVVAVAQELGMNLLEVSASSERTGTQLLKLVGEATQSKRLAHSVAAAATAGAGATARPSRPA
eukprot:208118-Chlamydomonas_euryale.AAC.1